MASNILGSDPAQTSRQIAYSKDEVENRRELPVTFTLRAGSPAKLADPKFGDKRYAGDIFQGKGVQGEFAMALTDPNNQDARQGTEKWMSQLMSGIYSPLDMGPPPGEMV